MAKEHIHLDLNLDLRSEPVSGELVPPGGPPTPFTGYTGLIAAIGRICEPATVDGPPTSDAGAAQ